MLSIETDPLLGRKRVNVLVISGIRVYYFKMNKLEWSIDRILNPARAKAGEREIGARFLAKSTINISRFSWERNGGINRSANGERHYRRYLYASTEYSTSKMCPDPFLACT